MTTTQEFSIRPATTERDVDTIIELIDGAAAWLRLKDTDQWARPWPTPEARRQRILDGLANGHTWIIWDGDHAAASVSITDRGNPQLWTPDELRTRAVYLHRLVVSRKYAGMGLGRAVLDWAAHFGRRQYGARIVRIDVWEDNGALHNYYRNLGFSPPNGGDEPEVRLAKEVYPSGAVFQRKIPRKCPRPPYVKLSPEGVHGVRETAPRPARNARRRLTPRGPRPVFTVILGLVLVANQLTMALRSGPPGS